MKYWFLPYCTNNSVRTPLEAFLAVPKLNIRVKESPQSSPAPSKTNFNFFGVRFKSVSYHVLDFNCNPNRKYMTVLEFCVNIIIFLFQLKEDLKNYIQHFPHNIHRIRFSNQELITMRSELVFSSVNMGIRQMRLVFRLKKT